jgi:erythromycin esterase-like protein
MWANWEIEALTEWLYQYNIDFPQKQKIGFYGLDVYSLWNSLDAIMGYLQEHDPQALEEAKKAIRCFQTYKTEDGAT